MTNVIDFQKIRERRATTNTGDYLISIKRRNGEFDGAVIEEFETEMTPNELRRIARDLENLALSLYQSAHSEDPTDDDCVLFMRVNRSGDTLIPNAQVK